MSIINSYQFTKTMVLGEELIKDFRNEFMFVNARPYVDHKGILPNGFVATLSVIYDDHDYGCDKSGKPRDNNILQTFDVTILDGSDGSQFRKGQRVKLAGFIEDASFAINFDIILRFKHLYAVDSNAKNKDSAS